MRSFMRIYKEYAMLQYHISACIYTLYYVNTVSLMVRLKSTYTRK